MSKIEEKRRAVEEILRWYVQNGARDELEDELREKLAQVLDAVTLAPLNCSVDQGTYFSVSVCDYHVGFFKLDEEPSKIFDVFATLRFSTVEGRSSVYLEGVGVEEHVEVNDEKTPLAAALVESIDWQLVRPVWQAQVEKVIERIAEAEWSGTLPAMLPLIIADVKRSRWIYEFQHLYDVLTNTAREFGITLNE